MVPKNFFLTKGVGRHKESLESFELALRDAGINRFNLVPVSTRREHTPSNASLIGLKRAIRRAIWRY